MTSTHIGRPLATVGAMLALPSPLPWLPRCRRHCHGCRVVATIATVAIAATTATAAAISATTSTVSAAIFCPHAASAFATVACPLHCRCWLSAPLPLLPRDTSSCSTGDDLLEVMVGDRFCPQGKGGFTSHRLILTLQVFGTSPI